jgi:hypothetical protein
MSSHPYSNIVIVTRLYKSGNSTTSTFAPTKYITPKHANTQFF